LFGYAQQSPESYRLGGTLASGLWLFLQSEPRIDPIQAAAVVWGKVAFACKLVLTAVLQACVCAADSRGQLNKT
jgi:hypothetical protein